jgi:hypothetical protein
LPYIETQMAMSSEFYIDRLITSSIEFAINKFKTSIFYALTFDITGQICTSFGWKTNRAVVMDVTYQYEMQDCSKVMIDDMSDWSGTFRGETARYIDSCSLSSGGGPINIKSFTLSSDSFEHNVIGG